MFFKGNMNMCEADNRRIHGVPRLRCELSCVILTGESGLNDEVDRVNTHLNAYTWYDSNLVGHSRQFVLCTC